ncbi:D-hexose-6-phosphate mutarotase [Ornithinimicrobium sp. INDO-MA30-4]|uniref:D-hexose-6-phosphate mutarotase n=1 Tax=Ornithinimicrobium sp. INDO-MA30-4 TaxID=2908651 RepID=UPI001F332D37|nr:D-hexose-6-phosphate mutarotase [Ornithinimicrobium sp. INDO-MA30-4]UJH71095.1 D-hexose-6-phosphate mutarotase [Ornithinimicrobium sp. INDO-MA30-4]
MTTFTPRTLEHGADRVTAYDHGAHVAEWTRDGVPVVWVSKESRYEFGTAIRGGVPLVWPWFGNGPEGDLEPAHGLLRTASWSLAKEWESGWVWTIDQEATKSQPGIETFPYRYEAQLEVEVRDGLNIALTVRNTDDVPFSHEAALHTYLHVGDIRNTSVSGLDGVHYFDKVLGTNQTQQGPLLVSQETDRIYQSAADVSVVDPDLGRTINVSATEGSHTVVWNPWETKARDMKDMGDDEWTQMVCIETARLGDKKFTLSPGQSATMATTISLQR